jgi:hypothetical protein
MHGVIEVPVTSFDDGFGRPRPAQICAASSAELCRLLDVELSSGRPSVVYVSHSFELLNRIRDRGHPIAVRRFEALCARLSQARERIPTVGYADVDWEALVSDGMGMPLVASSRRRTLARMCEQAYGNLRFERKWGKAELLNQPWLDADRIPGRPS